MKLHLSRHIFSETVCQNGLPDGVLNIVHGYGPEVGQAIVEHPEIKAIHSQVVQAQVKL